MMVVAVVWLRSQRTPCTSPRACSEASLKAAPVERHGIGPAVSAAATTDPMLNAPRSAVMLSAAQSANCSASPARPAAPEHALPAVWEEGGGGVDVRVRVQGRKQRYA